MQERRRLHVTPLNPELLSAVLPQQLLEKATDISFHTIQTFPEKSFAYINLPLEEADRLRKKLNGCLFRGQKMKVEEARPTRSSTRKESSRKDEASPPRNSKRSKQKTKEDGDTISAIELSKDRKVKRGWTEPESVDASEKRKSKKTKKRKSKEASITGGTECLFKAKLPSTASAGQIRHEKSERGQKRKRTGQDSETIVHEYRNSTRHDETYKSSVKADGVKQATEYVDDKGWVDDGGNVVEQASKRRKNAPRGVDQGSSKRETSTTFKAALAKPKAGKEAEEDVSDATSSSGTSNSDGEGGEESEESGGHNVGTTDDEPHTTAAAPAGLGISSTDGNEMQSVEVERLSISRSSGSPVPHVDTHPASQSTSHPSVEIFPSQELFKRPSIAASQSQTPKKPQLEVSTSFSFFDPDSHAEAQGGTSSMLMPQTPFTQQDIRHRRQRSAAPTPDTAAVGKTFGDVWGGGMIADDDDNAEEEDEEEDEDGKGGDTNERADGEEPSEKLEKSEGNKGEDTKEESEFAKFFWDQRGPNNRAWKRGRREAAKEKRKQERKERRG